MTGIVLFKADKTNTISQSFKAPAVIAGFNMAGVQINRTLDGNFVESVDCGDKVIFERLLVSDNYDIDCHGAIGSDGIVASAPLLDECGQPIELNACNNVVEINHKGLYRAIYVGDGRPNAIVTKD